MPGPTPACAPLTPTGGAHGKGKSINADDNRVASLCARCHCLVDQGKEWTEQLKQACWWAAHKRTVLKLCALELWPVGVPVPDVRQSPFELRLTETT